MSATSADFGTAPFFDVSQALESYRSSGFDLATAVGEIIDNSLEARATVIRVQIEREAKSIVGVLIADNGTGISADIMPQVLSLGFSSRFNQRNGMGRFGVGMKLAALSQGRRVDVWTKSPGASEVLHSYLDLDEVANRKQTFLTCERAVTYPEKFAHFMSDPGKDSDADFVSGTLVAWSQEKHLAHDGQFRSSVEDDVIRTRDFIARTYRRFINAGIRIYLDGQVVPLHDPLFLLPIPRVDALADKIDARYLPLRGSVISDEAFEVDDARGKPREVRIVVSVVPVAFRLKQGSGGRYNQNVTRIGPNIQGNVSLMRQGREIYYDVIPRSFPGGVTDIDRFIGVEISFPASLDELFRVRSVKRGAEPDRNLRDEIRQRLDQPIKAARKAIRAVFAETAKETPNPDLQAVTDAVNRNVSEQQRGPAGLTPQGAITDKVAAALSSDSTVRPAAERIAQVIRGVEEGRVEVVQESWPGRELLDVTHINGAVLVKLNQQHAILAAYRQIAEPLRNHDVPQSNAEIETLLGLAKKCIDALLLGYAKAESFDPEADKKFTNLRTFWGVWSAEYFANLQIHDDRKPG